MLVNTALSILEPRMLSLSSFCISAKIRFSQYTFWLFRSECALREDGR